MLVELAVLKFVPGIVGLRQKTRVGKQPRAVLIEQVCTVTSEHPLYSTELKLAHQPNRQLEVPMRADGTWGNLLKVLAPRDDGSIPSRPGDVVECSTAKGNGCQGETGRHRFRSARVVSLNFVRSKPAI